MNFIETIVGYRQWRTQGFGLEGGGLNKFS